jgi:two-component system sensor histidine kinase DesK
MLVFLVLYFRAYWVRDRQLFWNIGLIAFLGVLLAPMNPAASVYFIYAASFAGYLGSSTTMAVRVIAGLLLTIALESILLHLPPYFWAPAALFSVLIGALGIHYAERARDRVRLSRAEDEIEHMAKVAERERIARDLHDVLGHTLSLIVLKSELASKLSESDASRAAQEIKDVERISREALAQVRSTIRGYYARSLQAEAEQAATALEAAGIKVNCDFVSCDIPAAHEGVLALALREAVTNVIRHAKATSCELSLHAAPEGCRLEIADDGCGQLSPEGLGLTGMRQRVEALGGELHRDASAGTRIQITLPGISR